MSSEEVSTERLTQKPWPLPAFRYLPKDVAIVVLGQAEVDELDAALVEQLAVGVVGIDDVEVILVELEMALDQRQGSLADRSEPDHHDRALDATVDWPVRHGVVLLIVDACLSGNGRPSRHGRA